MRGILQKLCTKSTRWPRKCEHIHAPVTGQLVQEENSTWYCEQAAFWANEIYYLEMIQIDQLGILHNLLWQILVINNCNNVCCLFNISGVNISAVFFYLVLMQYHQEEGLGNIKFFHNLEPQILTQWAIFFTLEPYFLIFIPLINSQSSLCGPTLV